MNLINIYNVFNPKIIGKMYYNPIDIISVVGASPFYIIIICV